MVVFFITITEYYLYIRPTNAWSALELTIPPSAAPGARAPHSLDSFHLHFPTANSLCHAALSAPPVTTQGLQLIMAPPVRPSLPLRLSLGSFRDKLANAHPYDSDCQCPVAPDGARGHLEVEKLTISPEPTAHYRLYPGGSFDPHFGVPEDCGEVSGDSPLRPPAGSRGEILGYDQLTR